jgi:hypothetical protein
VSVAYLVLSHRDPPQVERLLRVLRAESPGAPLIVHHDDRFVGLNTGPDVHRVLPPVAVSWGWTSQLEVFLRCFAFALERVEFSWLVVLSGQDYPLRPLAVSERELMASSVDGYVQGDPVAPPAWTRGELDEFARRYFYRYRRVRPPGALLRRAVVAARPLLSLREMPWGWVLGRRCGGPGLPVRRGSDWLTLSRRAVSLLVGAPPAVVGHYRRTIAPSESFPQTVLWGAGLRLSQDPRRFSAWAPGSAHPAVLGVGDLDAMLASGCDFARKFDLTVDRRVLDALDRVRDRAR